MSRMLVGQEVGTERSYAVLLRESGGEAYGPLFRCLEDARDFCAFVMRGWGVEADTLCSSELRFAHMAWRRQRAGEP